MDRTGAEKALTLARDLTACLREEAVGAALVENTELLHALANELNNASLALRAIQMHARSRRQAP